MDARAIYVTHPATTSQKGTKILLMVAITGP